MTEKNKLSIVIVNYLSRRLVERCIQSLTACDRKDDIIVVDNSPEPEFHSDEQTTLGVRLFVCKENRGFAAGCNVGIEAARKVDSDYVLLLNPDTRASSDFITPMIDTLEANPSIGAAGPTILDDDADEHVQYAGGKINWWKGGPSHILAQPSEGETWRSTEFVTGCAMLLRMRAIEQTGLMDERYFLYFEDADYVEVIKIHGWHIAYIPSCVVHHTLSSTTGFQSIDYVFYFARNRLWYLRRWSPKFSFSIYLLILLLIKIPGAIIIFGVLRARWDLVDAFFRGTYNGLLCPQSNQIS